MSTLEDIRWLSELANRDEPPAVSLSALKSRGLTSGTREEFALLVGEGCEFREDTRDGSVWVNADDFVRCCHRISVRLGPPATVH